MLPYTLLHHLLLADVGATLVMTSGNRSDEPIAYRDDDAALRLSAIADRILAHDRPVHVRTDDSVVRARRGGPPLILRRSRGHVPDSVALPLDAPPLLACGAELKSTFCVAKGARAWVGHHIGDLHNVETLIAFTEGVAHFEELFAVRPSLVAHDLHPDYLSTAYALEREGVELAGVQHHHAHLAACLAEHGERGPAIGAIFDGTGLGTDGTVWGGELLIGDLRGFERAGHLWPVRLPGGDRAVRQPWRMACSWLLEATGAEPRLPAALAGAVSPAAWRTVTTLAQTDTLAPVTTSMGRLFDAVAALCGLRAAVSFEGQAAMELEAAAAAAGPLHRAYPLPVVGAGTLLLDARPAVRAAADDVAGGATAGQVAARLHAAVARATATACERLARRHGLDTVALAGGVFQNRLLLDDTERRLSDAGLRVLVPRRLPPNDGAISYGQAAVAAARAGG